MQTFLDPLPPERGGERHGWSVEGRGDRRESSGQVLLMPNRGWPGPTPRGPIDREGNAPYHRGGNRSVAGEPADRVLGCTDRWRDGGRDTTQGRGDETRDRERAARRGFAARIRFGSAWSECGRPHCCGAGAAAGAVPGVAGQEAAALDREAQKRSGIETRRSRRRVSIFTAQTPGAARRSR